MTMYQKKSILAGCAVAALALSLGAAAPVAAQNFGSGERASPERPVTRVGTRGAAFLDIPVGARANGLAGAGSVVTEGIDALYWNPAAAGSVTGLTAGLSYSEVFSGTGIEHYYTGILLPLAGFTFGVTVNSLTSGEIPRTQETTPSGENAALGSTYDFTATAIGVHVGRQITDRLVVGAAVKHISEGIQGARASWVGADVGIRFETGLYGTRIGASILNVGGAARMSGQLVTANIGVAREVFAVERNIPVNLNTQLAQLPTAFQFGVAMDLAGAPQSLLGTDPRHKATLMFDLRDGTNTAMQPLIAAEYGFNDFAFIRVGKRWENEELANYETSHGLSAGLGLRLNALGRRFDIDYGYMNLGILNERHVFSFQFSM
ncbi:MAG TPA: PorV/PorQ family protein [Longimicrobiales bacterium]|nr:PorV/PorQ family protein [Longimicrobiales bacterium]